MDTTSKRLMLSKLLVSQDYHVGGSNDQAVFNSLFSAPHSRLLVLFHSAAEDTKSAAIVWKDCAEHLLSVLECEYSLRAEFTLMDSNGIFMIENSVNMESDAFLQSVFHWADLWIQQNPSVCGCISGVSTEISELPILYSQVTHSLQMMVFSASQTRLWLPTQLGADRNAPSVYTKELNQRMFQKLIHYDFEAAREYLRETVQCAAKSDHMDIDRFKEQLFFLLETAAYMLGFRINKADQMPMISPAFMGDFFKAQTADELLSIGECFIQTVQETLNIGKGGSVHISSVIRYIENNYADPTVSATTIAQKFNKNLAQLSRQFKSEMNINLSVYLRQFRLSCAKQLLLDTDLTIDQIAVMTGWVSSKTFYRTFQEQEGITPKRYRYASRAEPPEE